MRRVGHVPGHIGTCLLTLGQNRDGQPSLFRGCPVPCPSPGKKKSLKQQARDARLAHVRQVRAALGLMLRGDGSPERTQP